MCGGEGFWIKTSDWGVSDYIKCFSVTKKKLSGERTSKHGSSRLDSSLRCYVKPTPIINRIPISGAHSITTPILMALLYEPHQKKLQQIMSPPLPQVPLPSFVQYFTDITESMITKLAELHINIHGLVVV